MNKSLCNLNESSSVQLNPFIIYEKGIFSFIVLLNNIFAQLGLRRQ